MINIVDGRRRPDQPLRALRRDRPRRRAREIRRAQPAGAAAGKRGKPSSTSASGAYFAARDWDAMAELLADDISTDDRRRVVNAGIRHGRDAEIANMRAIADLGVTNMRRRPSSRPAGSASSSVVSASSGRDQRPEAFHTEVLSIVEIDADERIVARRLVRPRRHRRRLRGTRRPIPRRRSGRPRAHVVGHRAALRRTQPARDPRDDAGLGEHRPPARDSVRAR